jgi:hypothetical protein
MQNTVAQSPEQEVPVLQTNAPSTELENVRKVMNLYMEGVRNGDVSLLEQAFHPKSSMFGWKGKDLFVTPIQGLFDYIASTPVPAKTGEPITFIITFMQVDGNAANVEMAMDSYHGHDFTDYFQLLKIEDRWWIVSKTFHAVPHNRY